MCKQKLISPSCSIDCLTSNWKLLNLLNVAFALSQDKLSKKQQQHDQHAQERDFQVGQSVMVSNMGAGPRFTPGTIIQKQVPVMYLIGVSAGRTWK